MKSTAMDINYVLKQRTPGANPFHIFESLASLDTRKLWQGIRRMDYDEFLRTAYWFAVSATAKSRAGMRCQVCNSGNGLNVHHRTYETHGKEHLCMMDLVVLCENCHGLFHGHRTADFAPTPIRRKRQSTPFIQRPQSDEELEKQIPEGDPVIMTGELLDRCRTNGSFTNATLRALGMTSATMVKGWTHQFKGKLMPRKQYKAALKGRWVYHTGVLD